LRKRNGDNETEILRTKIEKGKTIPETQKDFRRRRTESVDAQTVPADGPHGTDETNKGARPVQEETGRLNPSADYGGAAHADAQPQAGCKIIRPSAPTGSINQSQPRSGSDSDEKEGRGRERKERKREGSHSKI
jgi:hypothetical protein